MANLTNLRRGKHNVSVEATSFLGSGRLTLSLLQNTQYPSISLLTSVRLFPSTQPQNTRQSKPPIVQASIMSSNNTSSSSGRTSSVVTSHGTNSQASPCFGRTLRPFTDRIVQGNHWCTRETGSNVTNSNAYHYSNQDGSYYYSNSNASRRVAAWTYYLLTKDQGSTYYNDGQGNARYTPSGK